MKGVWHSLEDFLETDELAEETIFVSVHYVLLAGSDGVYTVLEGCLNVLVEGGTIGKESQVHT